MKEDPVITGVPGSVQLGEDVLLNCTTKPSMPAANILWYVDGKQEKVYKNIILSMVNFNILLRRIFKKNCN